MRTPAFPAMHYDLADNEHGLTMRDYFACRAPTPDKQWINNYAQQKGYRGEAKMLADWNYEYADAMMVAREA